MTFKRILMGAGAIVVLGLLSSTQAIAGIEMNCYEAPDGTVQCYWCDSTGHCRKGGPTKIQ